MVRYEGTVLVNGYIVTIDTRTGAYTTDGWCVRVNGIAITGYSNMLEAHEKMEAIVEMLEKETNIYKDIWSMLNSIDNKMNRI